MRGDLTSQLLSARENIIHAARLEQILSELQPSIISNAAAYNQVDVAEAEPLAAFQVNALAVRNLAMACRKTGAALVHFSTDYVFDGLAGRSYHEDDAPHPLGAYAVSKLAGELYAQAYLDQPLIIRTSGVFGPGRNGHAAREFRRADVETRREPATHSRPGRPRGFSHVRSGAGGAHRRPGGTRRSRASSTWAGALLFPGYEWAWTIFNAAELKPALTPTDVHGFQSAARRPKYSALLNAKAEALGIAPMPSTKRSGSIWKPGRRDLRPNSLRKSAFWALLLAFFCLFHAHVLKSDFGRDELRNLYSYWNPPLWQVLLLGLTFWNKFVRPMGAIYYLPLYHWFGLNPVPFTVIRNLILLANTVVFYQLARYLGRSWWIAVLAAFPIAYQSNLGESGVRRGVHLRRAVRRLLFRGPALLHSLPQGTGRLASVAALRISRTIHLRAGFERDGRFASGDRPRL